METPASFSKFKVPPQSHRESTYCKVRLINPFLTSRTILERTELRRLSSQKMVFLFASIFFLCLSSSNAFCTFISRTTQQCYSQKDQLVTLYNNKRAKKNLGSGTRSKQAKLTPAGNNINKTETDLVHDIFQMYKVGQAVGNDKIAPNLDDNSKQQVLFGQNVLSKISTRAQKYADNILTLGAFVSLLFVMLCGLGIARTVTQVCRSFPLITFFYCRNIYRGDEDSIP